MALNLRQAARQMLLSFNNDLWYTHDTVYTPA